MDSRKSWLMAALAGVAGFAALGAVDSRTYVQEGIVAQWDGIENGARGTHNSNATAWTDLSGHGHNLNSFATGYSWSANAFKFPSGAYGMCGLFNGTTAVNAGDYAAFDLYYTEEGTRTNKAPFIFGFGNFKGYCLYPGANMLQLNDGTGWALAAAEMTIGVPHHAYADYGACSSNTGITLMYDGVELPKSTTSDSWTQKSPGIGYGNNSNWSFHGGLHALRTYNRSLTAAEVGLNRAIDLVRFAGKTTAEVTLPEGYTWEGNTTGVTLADAITVTAAEGGQVALGNAAPVATATLASMEVNTPVELKAIPAAGRVFHRWTGDTTAIAAGSATTPTITVVTARKVTLTAEFMALQPVENEISLVASSNLLHRWSFNGDLADSVGGHTAKLMGSASWDNDEHPTAVSLPGGVNGTGAIDLGYNNFPTVDGPVTIEIWASQDAVRNWGRIFDIGLDNTSYMLMTWCQGTNINADRINIVGGSTAALQVDSTIQPFDLGRRYHIAFTVTPLANGFVRCAWAKRDAVTGEVLKSNGADSTKAWHTSQLASWRFWLGRSWYSGDYDAQATYDEVRVWNTLLTPEQLDTSAKLGPDRLPVVNAGNTFTVTASGAGKVQVNGGVAGTTTNVTVGTQTRLVLAAEPNEGAVFAGWEGKAAALFDTALTDATILVKPEYAADFTAIFEAPTVVRTATWTGAANDNDLGNAVNWTCRNAVGTVLEGTLPGAETVITFAGKLGFNVPAGFAFKQVIFGDITLTGDCDWRALGTLTVNSLINLNGHKLYVKGFTGKGSFTSPHAVDTSITLPEPDGVQPCLWLDAADASTLALGDNNLLKTWTSKDPSGVVGTACGGALYDATTYGRPVIDLGAVGSWKDVTYPRFTNLLTVFWVIRIANDGAAFLLGDANSGSGAYNFHRDAYVYGANAHHQFKAMWNGLNAVNASTDYLPQNFQLLSSTMKKASCSDSLSVDRAINPRSGGRQISELICYSSELSDAQRTQIVNYLQQKWFNDNIPAGELHLDVSEGETFTNTSMILKGNVRLVKDGLGTYVSSVSGQLNDGGFEAAAGTVKANAYGNQYRHGAADTDIVVDAGATFDVNGNSDFAGYYFTLAGGRLVNTGADLGNGTGQVRDIKLTADSTVRDYDMINWGHRLATLDLGEHVLTWEGANIYVHNVTATGGTIRKTDGVLNFAQTSFRGRTTALDVACPLVFSVNGEIGDVTITTPDTVLSAAGAGVFNVFGTFKPTTSYLHNFQLQDGSTLDLTTWTRPYTRTSPNTGFTLGFAANATVTVDVHGRTLAPGEQLIAWSEAPANVTFVLDAATAAAEGALAPVVTATGLFYGTPSATVTQATWTGTAGDGDLANPANWSCVNGLGETVADGLPNAGTAVVLAGENLNVQFPTDFTCASVSVGNGSLAADCDWRGLGNKVLFTGTLDLKGSKLYVSALRGRGTVTDSTGYDMLSYIESTGRQKIDTGYTPGSNTVVNLDFTTLGYTTDTTFFGTKSWAGNRFLFIEQANYIRFYGSGANILGFTANKRYNFKLTADHKAELYDDTETQLSSIAADKANIDNTQLTLFALNDGSRAGTYRLHAMQVYTGTTLQRDFVPVRNAASGRVGLLDRVNGIFYSDTRAGATPFIAGSTTAAGKAPGELHLEVAEGAEVANETVTLTGTLKLVKEGAGTFRPNKTDQRYVGGTAINAGAVVMPVSGSNSTAYDFDKGFNLGRTYSGNPITIASGATLDSSGNYDGRCFTFVLDGGTLANHGCLMNAGWGGFGGVTLTADSTFDIEYQTTFCGAPGLGSLLLNNHTLTIAAIEGCAFRPEDLYMSNGTIRVTGGGRFEMTTARDWSTVNLITDGPVLVSAACTVNDFITTCTGTGNGGAAAVTVKGVFRPAADATFPRVSLANQALLDLSQATNTVTGPVTFAAESVVKVALGDRRPAVGELLLAWAKRPDGNAFEWDTATSAWATQTLTVGEDGLHYGGDVASRVVNLAIWQGTVDGDVTKPLNWRCLNLAGGVVEDALPGEVSTLRLVGPVNMQVPKGTALQFRRLEFINCTLAADCDWRGLDAAIDGKVDLRGHKLYLSALQGSGEITDTTVLTSEYTGAMTTGDRLMWRGKKLSELGAIFGQHCGAYWGGANGAIIRGGIWGNPETDTTIKVQFQNADGGYMKGANCVFTEKADGVYARVESCRYIKNTNWQWQLSPFVGDSGQTIASSPTANGYNVWNVTAYGKPGELHLDVPAGTTAFNDSLLITGNVKFVKDGEGNFSPTKTGHTYFGGTELAGGVSRMWTPHYPNGYSGYEMIIDEGAKLDIDGKATTGGRVATQCILHVLNGGEVANLGGNLTDGWTMLAHIQLNRDSIVGSPSTFGIINNGYTPSYVDLRGHELTIDLGIAVNFYVYNTSFTEGKVRVTNGGWFVVNKATCSAGNTDFDMNCAMSINQPFNVRSYTARYTAPYNNGTAAMTVSKMFKPCSDVFYGCSLLDGVTLDLSERETEWSPQSTCTTGSSKVTFADSGSYKVNVAGRWFPQHWVKVAAWNDSTRPADTVKFDRSPETIRAGLLMKVDADGIYFSRQGGTVFFLR